MQTCTTPFGFVLKPVKFFVLCSDLFSCKPIIVVMVRTMIAPLIMARMVMVMVMVKTMITIIMI